MTRPSVSALVQLCWAVFNTGAATYAQAEALAAAEAWACGEEPSADEYRELSAALGKDERSEACAWALAAAHTSSDRERGWYALQALATLAALPSQSEASIAALAVEHGLAATAAQEAA